MRAAVPEQQEGSCVPGAVPEEQGSGQSVSLLTFVNAGMHRVPARGNISMWGLPRSQSRGFPSLLSARLLVPPLPRLTPSQLPAWAS